MRTDYPVVLKTKDPERHIVSPVSGEQDILDTRTPYFVPEVGRPRRLDYPLGTGEGSLSKG